MWFWYTLLGMVAGLAILVALSPVARRVCVFHLLVAKYLGLWLLDVVRVRWLVARVRGRAHVRLTRPMMIRRFCEDMGPTFIKFGQIVASSAGLFPERYVREFQKCLDRVRPFDFAEVEAILDAELGTGEDAKRQRLVDIDPTPLASASIAQVHTATLVAGPGDEAGATKDVVIKVQRPGIEARIRTDMRIMRTLARFAERWVKDAELASPVAVMDDFSRTIEEELDFVLEADNLTRFNEIMDELGHENIRAPVPEEALCTRRVLVMERFFGLRADQAEEIQARGVDAESTLVAGLRAWFQCVVFYGFFHGDVHAGNLMLLDDGDIGFLDFGIVGRFTDEQRWLVTDYIIAFSTGDYATLADVIAKMGGVPEDYDRDAFIADLAETYSPLREMAFGDINYADFLPRIQAVSSRHRMIMPREFVLITKQMLYFDRYAKLLAPDLNIFTDPRLLMSMMLDIQKARAGLQKAADSGPDTAPGADARAPDQADDVAISGAAE